MKAYASVPTTQNERPPHAHGCAPNPMPSHRARFDPDPSVRKTSAALRVVRVCTMPTVCAMRITTAFPATSSLRFAPVGAFAASGIVGSRTMREAFANHITAACGGIRAVRDTRPRYCLCGCRRFRHPKVAYRQGGTYLGCMSCDCQEYREAPRQVLLSQRIVEWSRANGVFSRQSIAAALGENYQRVSSAITHMVGAEIEKAGSGLYRAR